MRGRLEAASLDLVLSDLASNERELGELTSIYSQHPHHQIRRLKLYIRSEIALQALPTL